MKGSRRSEEGTERIKEWKGITLWMSRYILRLKATGARGEKGRRGEVKDRADYTCILKSTSYKRVASRLLIFLSYLPGQVQAGGGG